MNIAMISGLLAAAGNSSPISGLADLAGTGGGIDFAALLSAAGNSSPISGLADLAGTGSGIDFAALLSAAGEGQTLSGTELSGELQALLARAGKGSSDAQYPAWPASPGTDTSEFTDTGKETEIAQVSPLLANPGIDASKSENAKGLNAASFLEAGLKPSEKAIAVAGEGIVPKDISEDQSRTIDTTIDFTQPTEALLAAIAQALAGQTSAPTSGEKSFEPGIVGVSKEDEVKTSANEFTLTAALSPAIIPSAPMKPEVLADAPRTGMLPTDARSEDNPLPSAIRPIFPVDRNTGPSGNVVATNSLSNATLTADKDGEAFARRPFFPVDRNTGPSANALAANTSSSTTLTAGKDGEAFAKSFAEAANTAASPLGNAAMTAATAPAHRPHEASAMPAAIASPLHDRSTWTQEFGDRIVWMAKHDQQSADIRITPANLGPVQISLNIEDGKASAVFASPHAEVRQAIEEALPRLREMLNGAGISLDQANVGSQMPQQQSENAARFAAAPRSTGENAILPRDEGSSIQAVVTPLNRGRGLVDLFA